jgi:lipoprotein NlpI
MALGQFQEAIADYDELLKRAQGGQVAYLKRGLCRLALGDVRSARADMERCLEIAPTWGSAYAGRGVVRLAQNDPLRAADDFDNAFRHDLTDFRFALHRALARIHHGDLAEARAELREALSQIAPEKAGAWPAPLAHFLLGEIDEPALFTAAAAAKLPVAENARAAAHYAIGALHLAQGAKAAARENFHACHELRVYQQPEYALAAAALKRLDAP